MAYRNTASKDKAVKNAEATVERLTQQRDRAQRLLDQSTKDLAVATAEVEHRRTAPVVSEE